MTLAHVSSNSKNAADEKLRESMKRFMDTHGNGRLHKGYNYDMGENDLF